MEGNAFQEHKLLVLQFLPESMPQILMKFWAEEFIKSNENSKNWASASWFLRTCLTFSHYLIAPSRRILKYCLHRIKKNLKLKIMLNVQTLMR